MSAVAKLRERGREIATLAGQIRDLCGEDDVAFADTLDGETDAIEAARRVVRWLNEQAAHEAANRGLADTYQARARLFSHRQEGARDALLHFMQETGSKTLPLPEATLTVARGQERVVGEPDMAALPEHLVRVMREPDRTAIKQALKDGYAVPGCTLSNAQPILQIRTK